MVIVLVGLFGIAGSVTGSLAAMLAALFDPSILGTPGGNATGTAATGPPSIPNTGLTPSGVAGSVLFPLSNIPGVPSIPGVTALP